MKGSITIKSSFRTADPESLRKTVTEKIGRLISSQVRKAC